MDTLSRNLDTCNVSESLTLNQPHSYLRNKLFLTLTIPQTACLHPQKKSVGTENDKLQQSSCSLQYQLGSQSQPFLLWLTHTQLNYPEEMVLGAWRKSQPSTSTSVGGDPGEWPEKPPLGSTHTISSQGRLVYREILPAFISFNLFKINLIILRFILFYLFIYWTVRNQKGRRI